MLLVITTILLVSNVIALVSSIILLVSSVMLLEARLRGRRPLHHRLQLPDLRMCIIILVSSKSALQYD